MPALDGKSEMANTRSKVTVEIGVARRVEQQWQEGMKPVVLVGCHCEEFGHTMRNAEDPMTSSDRDSEEKTLSQDSFCEDSDGYGVQKDVVSDVDWQSCDSEESSMKTAVLENSESTKRKHIAVSEQDKNFNDDEHSEYKYIKVVSTENNDVCERQIVPPGVDPGIGATDLEEDSRNDSQIYSGEITKSKDSQMESSVASVDTHGDSCSADDREHDDTGLGSTLDMSVANNSIKTDDETDVTKDSAIVMDSPSGQDVSWSLLDDVQDDLSVSSRSESSHYDLLVVTADVSTSGIEDDEVAHKDDLVVESATGGVEDDEVAHKDDMVVESSTSGVEDDEVAHKDDMVVESSTSGVEDDEVAHKDDMVVESSTSGVEDDEVAHKDDMDHETTHASEESIEDEETASRLDSFIVTDVQESRQISSHLERVETNYTSENTPSQYESREVTSIKKQVNMSDMDMGVCSVGTSGVVTEQGKDTDEGLPVEADASVEAMHQNTSGLTDAVDNHEETVTTRTSYVVDSATTSTNIPEPFTTVIPHTDAIPDSGNSFAVVDNPYALTDVSTTLSEGGDVDTLLQSVSATETVSMVTETSVSITEQEDDIDKDLLKDREEFNGHDGRNSGEAPADADGTDRKTSVYIWDRNCQHAEGSDVPCLGDAEGKGVTLPGETDEQLGDSCPDDGEIPKTEGKGVTSLPEIPCETDEYDDRCSEDGDKPKTDTEDKELNSDSMKSNGVDNTISGRLLDEETLQHVRVDLLTSGTETPVALSSSTPAKRADHTICDTEDFHQNHETSLDDIHLETSVHERVASLGRKASDDSVLGGSSEHRSQTLRPKQVSHRNLETNISKFSLSVPNLVEHVQDNTSNFHDPSLNDLRNRRKSVQAIKSLFEKQSMEEKSPRNKEEQISQDGRVISRSKDEKRYSDSFGDQGDSRVVREVTVQSMGGGSAQQNGYSSNVARETQDREDVHFTEMSSVRNTFESGGPQQTTNVTQSQNIGWEEEEEGVYENQPDRLDNVARESDRDIGAELPEVGMAKNLLSRFTQIASEPKNYKREVTPPRQGAGKIEYESQPASHIQVYEGKAEAGIFESQPQINPDVVRSVDSTSEPLPERGTAKNIASKFKQLESGTGSYTGSSPLKREITPDRATGKVEFVSEPTATIERYEGKAEAGIFENQPQDYEGVVKSGQEVEEILPERGSAKNIAQRFKQMESSPSSAARGKREITPDRNTRGEYVSEPRAHVEMYEGKAEAGVFENRPAERSDVVRSEDILDEPLPERGFARNVASKFREMEHNMKSPPPTPNRVKEITPPREGISSGVYESQPQTSPDVISENAQVDEIVPEKGYARNLVSRFKEIEQENSKVAVSNRRGITPPRSETGVFENQPQEFIPDYNQKIDSGIAENNPEVRSDVAKETDPAKYGEELPERGTARNLVSHWKQVESQSGKQSPGSGVRTKEFTPPREEERVKALRGQLSPGAGQFESVNPNDLPGQYQQQVEPGVFENQPEVRTDVVSEAQTDWTEGMPKENAAKKMVAKFKNIQAEAVKEQPMPVSRKEDGDRQSPENEVTQEAATPKKKGGFFIPTTPADKCGACQKTVYAMEKFEMNKVIYHKNCFRCTHCKSKLTPKTFAANNGIIYCTNHLMQLFKSKGNYDEGFGREQHKKRWQSDVKDGEQEQS
ncbi:uncharacterized protein LOC124261982 isoform X5 [Haliotis rubra]|uniref:uncharacterized protein LOC124261982 isoform X5 n=2 Tax=Haliotis rubra TaxID=36100 RepID=UPI001EE5FA27|nr:uncharacterized protein LOC124261982 isoform X5 [Haliotis rubra]